MSKQEYTPGPWTVEHHVDEDRVAGHKDGYTYVKMMRFGRFETRWAKVQGGGGDADAHLIAAAPDLYEALGGLLGQDVRYDADVLHRALAAYAKARGDAQ